MFLSDVSQGSPWGGEDGMMGIRDGRYRVVAGPRVL